MQFPGYASALKWTSVLVLVGVILMPLLAAGEAAELDPGAGQSFMQPALTGTPSYTGLDIMFIGDQSGSMGGPVFDGPVPQANDPNNIRFFGPQYALQWLSFYRESILGVRNPRIRMSLMAFGTYTRTLLNWVPLVERADGSVAPSDEWTKTMIGADGKGGINADISVDRFGHTNLGDTDFDKALMTAQETFADAPKLPSGQNHLKAVIILTDGAPCVPRDDFTPEQNNQLCGSELHWRAQLEAVTKRVQTYFPAPDYQIFVVAALKNLGQWDMLQPMWEQAICSDRTCTPLNMTRVETMGEAKSTLNQILAQLLNAVQPPEITHCVIKPGGTCDIPPYQNVTQISVFKDTATPLSGSLVVKDSTGKILTPSRIAGETTPFEMQTFNDPQPGTWTIDINDPALRANAEIAVDSIPTGVVVDPPVNARVFTPVTLTLKVLNSARAPLKRYAPDYPLTINAEVFTPAKVDPARQTSAGTVAFTLDPAAPDYTYTAQWTPLQAGSMELRATATYQFPTSAPQLRYLIRGENLAIFDVGDVYFDHHGLPTTLLQNDPISIEVDIFEKGSSPPAPVLNLANLYLQVTTEKLDGSMPPLVLQLPNQGAKPGALIAEPTITEPGSYRLTVQTVRKDETGAFSPVESPYTYDITVRKINYLTLSITQPTKEDVDAQGPLPKFWKNADAEIRVEVRDDSGATVPLAAATGGSEQIPSLVVTKDGKPVDLGTTLQEVPGQAGVYALITDKLGMGEYELVASSLTNTLALAGDYRWKSAQDTFIQDRHLARFIIIGGIAGLLILLVLALLIWFAWRQLRYIRYAPLKGRIEIIERDSRDPRQTEVKFQLSLTDLNRNTVKLGRRRGLPTPIKSMTLTTNRNLDNSKRGIVIIQDLKIEGQPQAVTLTIGSPDEKMIHTDQYGVMLVIAKDMDYDFGDPNSLFRPPLS